MTGNMEESPQIIGETQAQLAPWEIAMVDVFVRTAGLIGLPRSIGEIYGLLYCSADPLSFDALVTRLGISRGSVSQGLKLLRQLGAVKIQYILGSRKDHYTPELSMERLVRGFVKDQFAPHLESGAGRLEQIQDLIESSAEPEVQGHATARLQTLHAWQKRTQKLIPIALAVLGGTKFFNESNATSTEVII